MAASGAAGEGRGFRAIGRWWFAVATATALALAASACGGGPNVGGAATPDGTDVPQWGAVSATLLVPRGSSWRFRDDGSDQGTAWRAPTFSDTAWRMGPAQLGYG